MLSLHVIILMHGGQTRRSTEPLTESLCMSFDSKISHLKRVTKHPVQRTHCSVLGSIQVSCKLRLCPAKSTCKSTGAFIRPKRDFPAGDEDVSHYPTRYTISSGRQLAPIVYPYSDIAQRMKCGWTRAEAHVSIKDFLKALKRHAKVNVLVVVHLQSPLMLVNTHLTSQFLNGLF